MKKETYVQPEVAFFELRSGDVICTSTSATPSTSLQNESYEEESTDGWY